MADAGNTSAAYGNATGPGAGVVVTGASIAVVAGLYDVTVVPSYGATAGPIDNMQLALPAASTPAGPIRLKVTAAVNGQPIPHTFRRLNLGGGNVQVQQVGADAAGVYSAVLQVTPVF